MCLTTTLLSRWEKYSKVFNLETVNKASGFWAGGIITTMNFNKAVDFTIALDAPGVLETNSVVISCFLSCVDIAGVIGSFQRRSVVNLVQPIIQGIQNCFVLRIDVKFLRFVEMFIFFP